MKICSVCQRCYDDSAFSCSEENHDFLTESRAGNCEVIPNYRLEFLDESSASGETYRAVNTILKKTYFIKIVGPELFDEKSKKRFLAEAQSLAAIIHPNVARVFESGTLADGSLYVVTEYFTAQTLRECLENVGAPSEVTALTITRQAAEGLEALHAAGVSHRHIRPENIILTADAENRFLVKLQNIDFGAIGQKQVTSEPEQNLSDLRYFSPEQCAAKETDAQTDVYSLGVVLYETLAGQVPFDSPYADALINKQINETPPPVKINSFDIRMLLTHTLTDALQKTTRTRLKSANAFARRIRHIEQLATHSSTPPPAMSYPAKMDKAAVVFTPPAKVEKTKKPVPAKTKTIIEDLPVVETPAVVENSSAVEMQTIVENPVIAEAIENPAPVEAETIFENLPVTENQPVAENVYEIEAQPLVEEMAFAENQPVVETTVAVEAAPVVEELVAVETQTFIEENLSAVETQTVIESSPEVEEIQTSIEDSLVVETQPETEDLPAVEARAGAENLIPVEAPETVTENAAVEIQPGAADLAPVEIQPVSVASVPVETEAEDLVLAETESESLVPFETGAEIEDFPAVELRTITEAPVLIETQPVIEEPVLIETQPENLTSIETEPKFEDSDLIEAPPIGAELSPPEIQTAPEEPETAAPVFRDLTTTKLPPLESVIEMRSAEKVLPKNIKITEIEPIFTLKSGFLDIHKTSEPVLVDWEQPDDVPTTTQTLNAAKKEIADAAFAFKRELVEDDEDYIIEAGEVDSPVRAGSEDYETRRDYAAERPVFTYDDSGTSWNLPGKRKVLTGAGLFALLVLAVGGTLLSRQFQTSRDARQTTAQSSPNVKTLPKSAEPEKLSESEKIAPAKPENLTVSNPSAAVDNPDTPNLPDYQPRETDAKTALPVSTENRGKKRVLKEAVEKLERTVQTKTAANETPVLDKKGNTKSSPDNKSAVKNQATTTTKTDIFTRPRIVKNPQF